MARVLYTAEATVTGGRANGHGRTSDGALDVQIRSPEELGAKADRLLKDPDLRGRLGLAGRERVTARFGRDRETDGYLAAYARLTPAVG